MQPLRIGVATIGFRQSLKQSLQTASDLGAQGVQFDVVRELKPADLTETGRRQFLHLLDELGLRVGSLHFPTRRTYIDPEHLEARVAATKSAMEFAYQLRAQIVTLRIGRIPQDPASSEYQLLLEILGDLARHGNRVGTSIAVIPSQDSVADLQQLLGKVTEGMIGIDFDPASCVLAKQNPAETLRALHNWVLHIQARDAIREGLDTGLEVPLGRGEVDWSEFIAVVDEIAYRGWLTAIRTQGEDALRDLGNAVQYLKQMLLQS